MRGIKITCPELTPAEKAERVFKMDVLIVPEPGLFMSLILDPNPRSLKLLDDSELEPSAEEIAQAKAFFYDASAFRQLTDEEILADIELGFMHIFGLPKA
jgi:hypothetical protein